MVEENLEHWFSFKIHSPSHTDDLLGKWCGFISIGTKEP